MLQKLYMITQLHMHLRDLVLINLHQIQIKLILTLNIITLKIMQ